MLRWLFRCGTIPSLPWPSNSEAWIPALFLLFVVGRCERHVDGKIGCGKTYLRKGRIADGTLAKFGFQPWQVALLRRDFYVDERADSFFCGAAPINEKHILSAAHGFAGESPSSLIAAFGIHNLEGRSDRYRQEVRRIGRIIIHEHYESRPKPISVTINDITLVKLADSVACPE